MGTVDQVDRWCECGPDGYLREVVVYSVSEYSSIGPGPGRMNVICQYVLQVLYSTTPPGELSFSSVMRGNETNREAALPARSQASEKARLNGEYFAYGIWLSEMAAWPGEWILVIPGSELKHDPHISTHMHTDPHISGGLRNMSKFDVSFFLIHFCPGYERASMFASMFLRFRFLILSPSPLNISFHI